MSLTWQDRRWRDYATCAEIGGDLWFPERGGQGAQAKGICAACPMKDICFEFAVNTPSIHYGIWGGQSMKEVLRERRARKIKNQDIDEWVDSILAEIVQPALDDEKDEWEDNE